MTTETRTFTPGPWHTARTNMLAGGEAIEICAGAPEDGKSVGGVYGQDDEAQANAHLIEAAPDLLAALKDARALIEDASLQWADAQGLTDTDATIAGIERSEWQITLDRVLAAIAAATA